MKGTINTQTIVGHLARVKVLDKLAEFTVATNGSKAVGEKTEWHDVKVISPHLLKICERLEKGQLLYVTGETFTESWETRDGESRKAKRVLAHTIEILNWGSGKGQEKKPEAR